NRVAKTVDATHRHPDEDKAAEVQPSHERLQVAHVRLGTVVGGGRPRRVTVPALVERQAAMLAPERETDEVPGACRLTAAVEEEDGRPPGYAPVDTVEGQAAQGELVGFRYDELVDRDSGYPRCSPEVRELLCGREGDARLGRGTLCGARVPGVDGEGRRQSRRKHLEEIGVGVGGERWEGARPGYPTDGVEAAAGAEHAAHGARGQA